MNDYYWMTYGMNHYTCIINLIGYASYLEGAFNFNTIIPIKLEFGIWMCLHGDLKFNILFLNSLIDMYAKCKINPFSIKKSYYIIPRMHYCKCIIDLLVHAKYHKGALKFISQIPIKYELGVWMCLLVVVVLNSLIDMHKKYIKNPYIMRNIYYIFYRMNNYKCIFDLLIHANYLDGS